MTVLLVTEEADLAADLVVLGLRRRGTSFLRFNADSFPDRARVTWDPLAGTGVFDIDGTHFDSGTVGAAWYRGPHRVAIPDPYVDSESRAFLASCWEMVSWRWVNPPGAVRATENKIRQLKVAADASFTVPDTVVSNDPAQVRQSLPTPMVAKTLTGAITTVGGVPHYVHAQLVDDDDLDDEAVVARAFIFQRPAKPATDVRVTVVGSEVFATDILLAGTPAIDWRASPAEAVSYRPVVLPDDVARRCVTMCELLGLSYGAFDLVRGKTGGYVFLELNPSGQWGWIEQATGQPITDAIVRLLVEADR